MAISDRDRSILDFESQNPVHNGLKEQKIRQTFDMTSTRYYQLMNTIIDDPEAHAYKPVLVGQKRRAREARQDARSAKRQGFGDLFQ